MSPDNATVDKHQVLGRRLKLMVPCSDCRGHIESVDQLEVSLVRFGQARCRACFIKAKLATRKPERRPAEPMPKPKRLTLLSLPRDRECSNCGRDRPLADYITKAGKDARSCSAWREPGPGASEADALFDQADRSRPGPQRSTPAGLNGPAGAIGVRRAAYGRSFDTDLETLGVATKRDRHKLAYETGLKGGSVIPGDCLEHDTTDVRIVAATMRPGDKDSDAKRIHRRVKRGIKKGTKSPRGPDFTESRCVYDRRRSDSSVDELVVAARRLTQASRSAQGLLPAVEDVVTIRAVAALLAPARDAPATEVHLRAAESRSLPRRPGKAK